jgi:hypothetical protein
MRAVFALALAAISLVLTGCSTSGDGLFDRDCTAAKAARGTAAKASVGIGNGCSPAEAVKDTAKRAVQ